MGLFLNYNTYYEPEAWMFPSNENAFLAEDKSKQYMNMKYTE